MRARKWFLRIAGGFVALVILLTLASAVLVSTRQRALKPLAREELARLGTTVRENAGALERNSPGADRPTGLSAPPEPATTAEATSATRDSGPEAERTAPPRLARTGTAAFVRMRGSHDRMSLKVRVLAEVYVGALKWRESALWLTGTETGDLPRRIGEASMELGDLPTARVYLHEALRGTMDEPEREVTCVRLAYIEDDPEVATLLLQRACSSGDKDRLGNAWGLAMYTRSDDLADFYFERWSKAVGPEKTAEWLAEGAAPGYPEVDEFKKRHAPSAH